eukprot:356647-Chlamydomonas_euryale.AAC.6
MKRCFPSWAPEQHSQPSPPLPLRFRSTPPLEQTYDSRADSLTECGSARLSRLPPPPLQVRHLRWPRRASSWHWLPCCWRPTPPRPASTSTATVQMPMGRPPHSWWVCPSSCKDILPVEAVPRHKPGLSCDES